MNFKISEKPKVEESLRGHNKNIKMTSSPARPLCGSSSKLSGREHGLITHVPAQWELYLLQLRGLHIFHDFHPFDVRTSGSVET